MENTPDIENVDIDILRQSCRNLSLPTDASNLLVMIYDAFQVFDDYADGDEVERKELDALIWNTLIAIPQNPFYIRNSNAFWPVLATAILKWQGSDTAERKGKANAKSFVWRAGFYDIVLMVCALHHGSEWTANNAQIVMEMYGETLEDYMEEFKNA